MSRADLHVHSWHSGYNHDLPFLRSRDCYADPLAVYRTAKARGMDFVTITDHDSIDGCLEVLSRLPDASDFIMGEEVSCWLPEPRVEVHFGVWGLDERLHQDLQPLRSNAWDVAARLQQADVPFAFNHPLHFYRGQLPLEDYLRLVDESPAVETRNGAMLAAHNVLAEQLIAYGRAPAPDGRPRASIGGSDAHTLRRVGRTWTEARGDSREAFLASLRAGECAPGGGHGGTSALAADIYGVIGQYWLSLAGLRPHELRWPRRALGLGFSVATAPFEFIPFAIAARAKQRESRWVRACARALEGPDAVASTVLRAEP